MAYVAEHAHLAYATTAYGVQGATAPESHTVLSDGLDAAGIYVGLTRGQGTNLLHIVAADLDDAREQLTTALDRDRADRGLPAATTRARETTSGLVADGPVAEVNAARARLTEQIDYAAQQAATWEQASAALTELANRQQHQVDRQTAIIASARARAQQLRAEIVGPLLAQATADGIAVVTAQSRVWELSREQRAARGLRKRGVSRALGVASGERWGSIPAAAEGVAEWAETVASHKADTDPRIIEQRERVGETMQEQRNLAARHTQERRALNRQVFGDRTPTRPRQQAAQWRQRAEAARRALAAIEALPVTEAAQLIRDHAEQQQRRQETTGRAIAARTTRAGRPARRTPTPSSRGLGL